MQPANNRITHLRLLKMIKVRKNDAAPLFFFFFYPRGYVAIGALPCSSLRSCHSIVMLLFFLILYVNLCIYFLVMNYNKLN